MNTSLFGCFSGYESAITRMKDYLFLCLLCFIIFYRPIIVTGKKKTKCDIDAPYWYNSVPYEGAIFVSPHYSTFRFELRDEQSGIDLSTFRLKIDGMEISAADLRILISGYNNHYKVIYQYPEDHVFAWGQRVDIYLSVCDDSSNCLNDSSFL